MKNVGKEPEFEKLVKAVIYLQANKVKEILESEWYRKNAVSIINAVCRDLKDYNIGMNLCQIAACWKICLGEGKAGNPEFEEEWGERFADMRSRINEIIDMFKSRFLYSESSVGLNLIDDFHCFDSQNADDWAGKFNLPYGVSRKKAIDMLSKKYRQIDVELWVAYQNQEYGRMKTLLSFGSNPFVLMEDNDCVYDRLGWHHTDVMHEALNCLYDKAYENIEPGDMASWLFQWCESEQLTQLLDSYCSYEKRMNLTSTLDRLQIKVGGYCPEEILFEYERNDDICHVSKCSFIEPEVKHIDVDGTEVNGIFDNKRVETFLKMRNPRTKGTMLDGKDYSFALCTEDGRVKMLLCNEDSCQELPIWKALYDFRNKHDI